MQAQGVFLTVGMVQLAVKGDLQTDGTLPHAVKACQWGKALQRLLLSSPLSKEEEERAVEELWTRQSQQDQGSGKTRVG